MRLKYQIHENMKATIHYILILLLWNSILVAQENDESILNIVDLGTGMAYPILKRAIISDFQYAGWSYPTFHFGYTRRTNKWLHQSALYFHYSLLSSPNEVNLSEDTRGELTYQLYKKIWDAHRLKVWGGGTTNLTLQLNDFLANGIDRGNAHALWFMASLGGMARVEYQLPKGELLAEINWLPFSLNRRSGYANEQTGAEVWFNSGQNGELETTPWRFSTLDIYTDIDFSLTYHFPLTWNTDMDIRYTTRYFSFDTPEFYGLLRQSISVIFKFKW